MFRADLALCQQALNQRCVFRQTLPAVVQVGNAFGAANGVGAVVRGDQNQGVVQLAGLLQKADELAHVLVHVVYQRGIALHVAGKQGLLLGIQTAPLGNAGVAWRQGRMGLHQLHGLLPAKTVCPHGVPAGVVAALVAR